jgi:hypothetical protein
VRELATLLAKISIITIRRGIMLRVADLLLLFLFLFIVDISINLRRVNNNIAKLLEQYKKAHGA